MNLRSYLAQHPTAEQIGVFDANLESLPTRYEVGVGNTGTTSTAKRRFSPARALNSPTAPLYFVAALVLFFLAGIANEALAKGRLSISEILAGIVFVVIAAALVWPRLVKLRNGVLNWSRQVDLTPTQAVVLDTTGKATDRWVEPLEHFAGISHRRGVIVAGGAPAGHAGLGSKALHLDIIELVHPEPGKTLLLYSAPATGMGGMSMTDVFDKAHKRKVSDIKETMSPEAAPKIHRLMNQFGELLGLPVLADPPGPPTRSAP